MAKSSWTNSGPHFARACAITTHFNIHHTTPRKCSKYSKHHAKCSGASCWASLRSRNALRHHTTLTLTLTLTLGQNRGPHFARACAAETHSDIIQHHDCAANATQNAHGQTRGASFCASLRSRNARRHHTTSRLRGKGHATCSRPGRAPRSSTTPFLLP